MKIAFLVLLLGGSLYATAQYESKTYTADSTTAYTLRVETRVNIDNMPTQNQLSDADSQSVIDSLLLTEPLSFEDAKQQRSGSGIILFDFQSKEKPKTNLNIFTPPYRSAQD
ncbi:MAG: hypothetical protein RJQ14_14145 [Marinoscillum sp.]